MSDPIVGIDLGTSNSVVAHVDTAGAITVLADDTGGKIHPSVVSFHPSGGVVVGAAAKQRKVIDPQNTIYSVKRLIGRSFRSPEVQTARARSPFQIKEGPNSAPLIATRAGEFAVPEISAIVLDHVRNIAAARLGAPVNRAVVTVPASFNDAQRSATATAGAIAGLTVVRVLNEPTAAALAYGHTRHLSEIIAVYDFGGGTFDITLLRLTDQVYEVLGTSGDTFLGGDDLDERLVAKMVAKFLADHRIDLRTNEVAMMRLRAVAEQAKIELSRRARAVVRIDEIAHGPRGTPLNLQIEIARDEFIEDVVDLVDRTFPVCTEALALANLSVDHIADVVLVGGTTKVPYVREQVTRFFHKPPRTDVNPEDAVAVGAALQAASLARVLSRRASSRIAVPPARAAPVPPADDADDADDETLTRGADVLELADPPSGATAVPVAHAGSHDRPRRATGGLTGGLTGVTTHPESESARHDTSYSVTRAGVRDQVAEPERYPGSPLPVAIDAPDAGDLAGPADRTPLPFTLAPARAIGRMARPVPPSEPPAPPGQVRTLLGGPAVPSEIGAALGSASAPGDHDLPSRPITATGMASPPPLPRPAARPGSGASPATPHPVVPAQPTAPTLVARAPDPAAAATPRGIGARPITAEPSPASTVRGFSPPQSYPVSLADAALPQLPRPPPILLEVTPRGLGIATVAGFCEELIRRNSRVPTEIRKLFTTSRDQQELVRIVVCQGESRRLDNNTVIGDLVLQNLPRRPRGETSIEVTFSLDPSGVLHVRARDAQTGVEQHAALALTGGVAVEDVAASRDRLQHLRR